MRQLFEALAYLVMAGGVALALTGPVWAGVLLAVVGGGSVLAAQASR